MSGGCEVPGGTSSSASPWLWQLRHTTVRSRTPPYGDRSQAPEPKRGKSARSTKPYGDRRDFPRGCGQHSSSRCSRRGVWSGTSWRIIRSLHRWCSSSMLLCRRWWTQCWSSSVLLTCRLASRSSQCPGSPLTVSRSVWWSGVSLRWWNSWCTCRLCCLLFSLRSRSLAFQLLSVEETGVFMASPWTEFNVVALAETHF